ncbi:hypothetical protein G9A89_016791 [Geosiphon pyriformis]|nr:hypothetical protein G9A89_016791 [Geosiphon pyriformis]
MGQDQLLAVLPNVVSFGRLLPVLESKQSSLVGSPFLENWADQMETESSSPLVSGATFGSAWEIIISHQRFAEWVASTLVPGITFKIKLAHVKTVFQSVLKDNVKLLCVEFVSQVSLKAAFLVKLTSFIHLATFKIAKSLVIFESGSLSAAVALRDMPLDVSAIDIKTALSVFVMFGSQADLDLAVANTNCKVVSFPFSKAPKVFKPHFVGSLSYAKTSTPSVMSEFPSLVAFTPLVAVVDPAIRSRLDSLKKQISDLAALVKSIVEPVGSLVALVSHLLNNNAVKTVQLEKDLLSIKYASNNFANLLIGVSKNIVCLRFKVDFGDMDYDEIQTTVTSDNFCCWIK